MSYEDDREALTELYNRAIRAGDTATATKAGDHLLHTILKHTQQQDISDHERHTMQIKNLHTIPVGPDEQIQIEYIKEAGQSMIRIGNFVPSLQSDGRGVTFPPQTIDALMEALKDVQKTYGRTAGAPGPGQGQLDI
jgi:hypothetical protein